MAPPYLLLLLHLQQRRRLPAAPDWLKPQVSPDVPDVVSPEVPDLVSPEIPDHLLVPILVLPEVSDPARLAGHQQTGPAVTPQLQIYMLLLLLSGAGLHAVACLSHAAILPTRQKGALTGPAVGAQIRGDLQMTGRVCENSLVIL